MEAGCLSHGSIVVKLHHDQGNSYKRKHLVRGLLILSEVSPLLSWQGAWPHTGTAAVAQRFSAMSSKQRVESEKGSGVGSLQQGHTSSTRTHLLILLIFSNISIPW